MPPTPMKAADERAREQPRQPGAVDFETTEVRDFSRTIAQIEWLLVVLVLAYHVFHGTTTDNGLAIYLGVAAFSCVIIVLHHLNLVRRRSLRLLAIETWIMILFITWIIFYTGRLHSPLLSLYLLPIVTSALTLGQRFTLLDVGLVAACYALLGYSTDNAFFSRLTIGDFAAQLAPMLLVAYITTMLSTDILNAMAKIKLISDTDELTGIYNVRAFNSIAQRDFHLAERHSRSTCVMMVDSDNLKKVNDTYGHDAGDQLIKHVVKCIKAELRSTDVVARYGGDEFVCLLPETDSAAAELVAERIRRHIAGQPLRIGDTAIATSVSIGIAAYPEHGPHYNMLTKNADRALYAGKAQGRNRVVVFTSD